VSAGSATLVGRQSNALRHLTGVVVGLSALALILPHHAPPWMFFLQELLAASALALLAIGVLFGGRRTDDWRAPDLLVLGLLVVVALQYALGLINTTQVAWIHALYLLALLLAIRCGAALEARSTDLGLAVLLLPALLAGIVSVGLQVYQWLFLAPGEGNIWVYRAVGGRMAANLGQPNLLATVHVIALLAAFWLWRIRHWPAVIVLGLAMLSMIGLALTQSRTGLINAWLVAASLLLWHRQDRTLRWVLPTLAMLVLALFVAVVLAGQWLAPISDPALAEARVSAGTRPAAWWMLMGASFQQPIFGYGWGQTFSAQLAAAPHHPSTGELYFSAHNLLLDLALWNGWPVALVVIGCMAAWLRACLRRCADDPARLMLLYLVVLLVHSMFEHPLTYAYFLLPFGLAAGMLSQRIGLPVIWRVGPWITLGMLAVALGAAALTTRDYLRVEHSYRQLMLEIARIDVGDDRAAPDVLVLDSLRDLIIFSRLTPSKGMSRTDLEWMTQVVRAHPGPYGFAKLAQALALNDRSAEAQDWVDQLCRIFLSAHCQTQAERWSEQADQSHALRSVRWP
jgi:hypothetical protein